MTFTTADTAAVLNAGRGTAYSTRALFCCAFTANPTDDGMFTNELNGGGNRAAPVRPTLGTRHRRHVQADHHRHRRV